MLYIASDHAGFQLKNYLVEYLKNTLKKEVTDLGPAKYDDHDDYPDFAALLSQEVVKSPENMGILICGSGQGMCIAANKFAGIRAGLGYSISGAEMARQDDDINVLCLAGRVLSSDFAAAITKKFLETKFKGAEKHQRRIDKIKALEK